MLALVLAGGLHPALAIAFVLIFGIAWKIEDSKWQLSERVGLVVVLVSIPLFILDWQYQKSLSGSAARFGVDALAHLIVFLAAVKLLQVKKDRDWVFLYLISFFEVLLAAGLTFSPIFLGSLALYLLCALSTVLAFEIHKRKRSIPATETRLLVPPDSRVFTTLGRRRRSRSVEAARLPVVAVCLLIVIFVFALPLFLVAPRTGAAGMVRGSSGLSSLIGFSDTVTLGQIGQLKGDNEVVMHVRIEGAQAGRGDIRWRGVALDEFTGRGWRKSDEARRFEQITNDRGLFQLGTTEALNRLTTQTVFLEPIESPVLFAASRPVAIQGDFSAVRVDTEGSVQSRRVGFSRVMYKALSDLTTPDTGVLRSDRVRYSEPFRRYLELPGDIDPRIGARTNAIVVNAHARNRYDIAKAIEKQLQEEYGYTLEMRASGPEPLSDFLFNVKAGHCEYFATAMAVMLRTQGVASRVVNGFLPGEYNDAAGAYTVRQSDAHSWVEVYFPETRSWVTFDPTPAAGRTEPASSGWAAQLGKYAAALELLWFQYVVDYDQQEQRSLAASLSNQVGKFRRSLELIIVAVSSVVSRITASSIAVVAIALLLVVTALIAWRLRKVGFKRFWKPRGSRVEDETSSIVFYERLTALLSKHGLHRDSYLTPLEFAGAINSPPALTLTRAYNRVRFGHERLSAAEVREIEQTLKQLEEDSKKEQ